MRWFARWAALGVVLSMPLVAAAQPSHTVRPGETLWGIAQKYFGKPLLWPGVQRSNGVGQPESLQVGQALRLGDAQADSNAQASVVAVHGDVREGAGAPLQAGASLAAGAKVWTGPDSFVTLRLPDGSLCTLPSNSVIRLVRFLDASGSSAVLLDLDAGEVESRVPKSMSSARGAFRVRTRMATVGVRGTHFRVRITDEGRLAVSVLESGVAIEADGLPAMRVQAPNGIVLEGRAAAGAEPARLLPPPDWVDAGRAQSQPDVMLEWLAVEGATGYRAQVARDVEFLDVVAERYVGAAGPSVAARFDAQAPGAYFARVAGLTSGGLEGQPAVSAFVREAGLPAASDATVRLLADSGELAFDWKTVTGETSQLEIAEDAAFTRMVVVAGGLVGGQVRLAALPPGQYHWRVRSQIVDRGQLAERLSATRPLLLEGAR